MATPAANQLEAVITAKFPGTRFGRSNCRTIAGSTTYSQHAWNNARDIYAPLSDPNPKEWVDRIHRFLEANFEELNVRLLLWQVEDHYGHMHADLWPSGYGIPPCAGGAERYKYPGGVGVKTGPPTLINKWEGDLTPTTPQGGEDMLQKGNKGNRVKEAQKQLIVKGYPLPKYGADGDFGDETVVAVKQFQTANVLIVDGVLQSTDLAILFQGGYEFNDQRAWDHAEAAHDRLDDVAQVLTN